MSEHVTIAPRFYGPPRSGNGGYSCGLAAAGMEGAVEATLRRPPPLDQPPRVTRGDAVVVLQDGDECAVPIVRRAAACGSSRAVAVAARGETAVLGRMTAEIEPTVTADEPCVVVGWAIGRSGRKLHAGTALYDAAGTLRGRSLQTWIAIGDGTSKGEQP